MIKVKLGIPNTIMSIRKHLPLITLNVNSPSSPVERPRLADRIKKTNQLSVVYKKHSTMIKTPTDL